jgi:hypothetical protein
MIPKLFLKKKKILHTQAAGRKPFYIFNLVILLLSLNTQAWIQAPFLQESTWSVPQTIPGYELTTWPPILIADQNRTIHAFSSQWIQSPGQEAVRAVVYNSWTLENGWTSPVDILISPLKEARLTDVYLDQDGIFHLIFWGGDNTSADIYYSKVPAGLAGDAGSWSAPLIIGENAADPESAAILKDKQGILHVLYGGLDSGYGVYEITSPDNGDTWSSAAPVFFSSDQAPLIVGLHTIIDESGELHAIWNTRNLGGQGRGVYYSRLNEDGNWNDPTLIDQASEGYGINYPTIQSYQGSIFVVYLQTPKVMMRRSQDNGLSWGNPVTLFSRHVGVNGLPSMVVDSDDRLHLFFGQRIDPTTKNPVIHGMWHSMWRDNRWNEPEAVVKGLPVADPVGNTSFDPFEAHAVVSQGNVILVTWITDPGWPKKPNGVWYSYISLDTPELPVVPFSTVPPSLTSVGADVVPTQQASPTPDSDATFEAINMNMNDGIAPKAGNSPAVPMIIALTVSFLFLLFITIRAYGANKHQ